LTGELDFLDLALPFKKMVPRLLFKKVFAFTGIPRFWEQRKKKPAQKIIKTFNED
jgi:hypothetical protein